MEGSVACSQLAYWSIHTMDGEAICDLKGYDDASNACSLQICQFRVGADNVGQRRIGASSKTANRVLPVLPYGVVVTGRHDKVDRRTDSQVLSNGVEVVQHVRSQWHGETLIQTHFETCGYQGYAEAQPQEENDDKKRADKF